MNNAIDQANKSEEAVEKALSDMLKPAKGSSPKLPATKSFAPPDHKSIRELIDDLEDSLSEVESRIKIIKARLEEFYRLQNSFYVGPTP